MAEQISQTNYYPAPSFHFMVWFFSLDDMKYDMEFQSVSGLQAQIETESIKEGGQNNFEHVVPTRRKFSDLILKRGVVTSQNSDIVRWFNTAFDGMAAGRSVEPLNLQVVLLNDQHAPLIVWDVIHAWPKSWKYSDLDAEKGELLIETLELNYNRFTVKGRPFESKKP